MKKLLIFLMIAIPLVIILVVNLTVSVVSGFVSIPVDSISLNMTQIEAKIDETVNIEATIYPKNASNQEIIWSSTNEDVARVDSNGNVNFIGFGSGYIIATTSDGNKKASCYYYITDTKPHEIYLTSEYKENENYFVGIDKTLQLKSIVYPAEAINKDVYYTSEDETVATVDANGLVRGIKEGKVKIVSTSAENNLISSSIIVEVVKPLETLFVSEENVVVSTSTYQISYDVYPKDATITAVQYKSKNEDIATVNSYGLVTFKQQGIVEIELTSLQGQIKASMQINYTNGYAYDLILETNAISEKIEKGETYINYTTMPLNLDVDVTFTSDDESVVYVDDSGYVQFIGGGNTLIRARVQKNETEFIEKIISIYIESPATDIIIDDNYTIATKQLKLLPKSYPSNSTNQKFYFISKDTNIATVSEDGVVTFIREGYCSVEIDIYANERNSSVKKTISVTCTNGYPTDLVLKDENIEINYGDFAEIETTIYPLDIQNKNISYKIISQTQNDGGNNVIELLGNGSIKGVGGGIARVEISCEKYSGEKIKKYCDIIVNRKVENVQVDTDLILYEEEYVTCNPLVEFNISSLTLDATNNQINWELISNNAIRRDDNSIYFNNSGVAKILISSEDGNYDNSINIRYMKGKIISAEIETVEEGIDVGQEFEFKVLSTIPHNAVVNPYLRISNQSTLNSSGQVFEIVQGTKIRAVSGGTATVTVVIANLQYTFEMKGIRQAESIEVSPSNIKTTNARVKLQTKVLPEDTSNKEVEFLVRDENVAIVKDGYLIFKKNGIANIVAKATDNSGISYEFTIEKIEKGMGDITVDGQPINMLIGETNALNFEEGKYEEINITITSQTPIIEGETVITLENNIIKALANGSAEIKCILTDEYGSEQIISIQVNVIQLCEEIKYDTELDFVQETYLTAEDVVNLNFKLLPEQTTDKTYKVSVIDFISQTDNEYRPFISDGKLNFTVPGTAIIKVESNDGATFEQFSIKYTGGDAISATLNYEGIQTLSVGETLEINVSKWVPYNTINKQILLKETTHTQGVSKVVEISNNRITAVAGGTSRILVEVSNQIFKELTIIVINKVENIRIDDKIISSSERIVINPVIEPANATNKTLIFNVDNKEIARIEDKTVIFSKPGKVILTLSSTDGSNITKSIEVISTYGYVDNLELNNEIITMKKNDTVNLYVKRYYPSDASYKNFAYKIISNITNDGSEMEVVSVSSNGVIRGLYGGKAIVRVFTTDYYGNEVYKDCEIEVISDVSDLEITFNKTLAESQGSIVVAKPYLKFNYNIYPADASNKEIDVVIDNNEIATVNNDTIHFLKTGKVNIQFISKGNNNIVKNISFYFTDDTLIDIAIDTKDFTENGTTLTLKAGEEYKLSILSCLPSDKENVVFTIENKTENRMSQTLQVMSFENGVIKALNGGEATFTLKADAIEVGKFCVRVYRDCSSIYVESNEIFVNYNTLEIKAAAYPKDTYQKDLKYSILSSVATIDNSGKIIFTNYGTATVTISSVYNENVYTVVLVEYANQVKKISFKETVSMIYSGYKVQLEVIGEPFNVAEFKVIYSSSDENIATVNQTGLVVAGEKQGSVTISAYVEGKPDIKTERTFNIVPVLSALELELDKIDDDLGIGRYRVWGTQFVSSKDDVYSINNYYKMNIKVIKPENSGIKLVWKSSNEEIATVDENGVVLFNGATGQVTISVEPETQYNPAWPQRDSYTFNLVDGINVYNVDDFKSVINSKKSIVLQNDLNVPSDWGTIELTNNLYGNGHIINFSANAKNVNEKVIVRTSGVLIDNVVLRGTEFQEKAALSELEGTGKILEIRDRDGSKTTGVVIRNSKIENAYWGIDIRDSEVKIQGCIIRNALSSCIQISSNEGTTKPSVLEVERSIISRALFSAILFELRNNQNVNYKTKLIIKEDVKIYNWLKLSEFKISFVEDYIKSLGITLDITNEARKILLKNPDFIYNYNGEEYFMLGIGMLSFDISIANQSIFSDMKSNGTAEVPLPYVFKEINEQITYTALYADIKMWIYTLPNNQTNNTPASTYTENSDLYDSLRIKI